MDKVLEVLSWIYNNYDAVILNLVAIFTALVALAMVIPGDQPDKVLQSVVDFIKKFSKK